MARRLVVSSALAVAVSAAGAGGAKGAGEASFYPQAKILWRDLYRPGRSVRCAVTPSDGRLSGPTATAR